MVLLVGLVGCAADPGSPDVSFESVRERLAAEPTRLVAAAQPAAGTIDAMRRAGDGWQDGTTPVSVTNGELVLATDSDGALRASTLAIAIDPIEIPEAVFGKPAQLADVRLVLAQPVQAAATWIDDNNVTATLAVQLDLSWSLSFATSKTPLGTQHLPALPVAVTLAGTGDHVAAQLALHADEVWSWADLVKLEQLQLTIVAATVD